MKTGFSATRPEEIIRHGGGYQLRFDIEQIEKASDEGTVTEWRYAYLDVPGILIDPADYYLQAVKQRLVDGIQAHLDSVARSRGYDHILSLCSYAASADPAFAAEAQAGVAWRDAVWRYGYQVLVAVEGGTRPIPTLQGLLDELPPIGW